MKQLVCEMCGSKDLIKDGGVFVCQSCGCKYTVEEAKKMMIEGTVRVDNTHMIENYLSMANNAYRSSNNAEAENYCNKVIEIDPTNYQALMLKGKTAGWQSTLSNNRFQEAINCFSSAIDHAPDEEKEALTNDAVEEVKKLSLALTKLQGDRFEKWPDDEEAAGLLNVVVEIYKALIHFASSISTGVNKDEIMSPVAQIINNSVIGAWSNKAVPEYRQDSDGHPDKYAFSKLLNRGDYCLKLLEQANDLSDGDDSADITRLENMIAIQELCINGCAYEYKTVATGTDIWDGSTIYGNRYVKTAELTDQAKALRRKLISDYRNKISTIKASIARKEAAEKAEKERKAKEEKQRKVDAYWAAHPEKKEQLIAEKHELELKSASLRREYEKAFGQLKDQKVAIRAENDRVCNDFDSRITSAYEELKQLGLFKTKEKKVIRERIDQLTAEKNEAKREYDAQLAALNNDIERIEKETEDRIRPISNGISTIDRVLAEVWKDADRQIDACQRLIREIKAEEEADRIERQRNAEEDRLERQRKAEEDRLERKRKAEEARIAEKKAAKKRKITIAIVTPIIVACIAFVIVLLTVIIPNQKYNTAIELYDNGKYEDAIVILEGLNGYKDCATQIEKCYTALYEPHYQEAMALIEEERYEEAISAFAALLGYKDSELRIEECYIKIYGEEKYNLIKNTPVGGTLIFGKYEQDNIAANGKEDIEWIVLDKNDMSMLLISKYALDCKQYHTSRTGIKWASCSLRTWLNSTFLNDAFDKDEQNRIMKSTTKAEGEYGHDVTDMVFLFNSSQAYKYFNSADERKCIPTKYAKAQGAWTDSNEVCCWWLLSNNDTSRNAPCIRYEGDTSHGLHEVDEKHYAVRPAIWIDFGVGD